MMVRYHPYDCHRPGKAASSARGACGHFVGYPAILRTFSVKYHVLLAKNQGRRVEDGEFRFDKGDLRY